MIHELKTDPIVFDAVAKNEKKFEIRKNDRFYTVGDTLELRKTVHSGRDMKLGGYPLIYTGDSLKVTVTHILKGGDYGLDADWVIMSIEHIPLC